MGHYFVMYVSYFYNYLTGNLLQIFLSEALPSVEKCIKKYMKAYRSIVCAQT